jgi:hypothetical protein
MRTLSFQLPNNAENRKYPFLLSDAKVLDENAKEIA